MLRPPVLFLGMLFALFQNTAHSKPLPEVDVENPGVYALPLGSTASPQPTDWALEPVKRYNRPQYEREPKDFWIPFKFRNKSPLQQPVIISQDFQPDLMQLELWQKSESHWRRLDSQDFTSWSFPPGSIHQPHFQFQVPPGHSEYLIKARSRGNRLLRKFTLWEPKRFIERIVRDQTTIGFILGVLYIGALFNLLLALAVRNSLYAVFAAYILGSILYMPLRDNYYSSWFGLNLHRIDQDHFWSLLLAAFSLAALVRYCFLFLDVQPKTLAHRLFWGGLYAMIFASTAAGWLLWDLIKFFNAAVLVVDLLLLGVLIRYSFFNPLESRHRARWLLASFGITLVGLSMEQGMQFGLLSNAFRHAFFVGLAIEVSVLSIYMAFGLRRLQLEKEQATQRLVESQQRYSKELEQQVAERTSSLALANAELRTANHTKDRFFSIIGHDLQGPMNSLNLLFSKVFKQGSDISDKAFVQIQSSIGNLSTLLKQLLSWGMAQSGELQFDPTCVPLSALAEQSLKLVEDSARQKGVEISYELEPELTLRADWDMANAILRNLGSNAVKFSPPGGRIFIRAVSSRGKCQISVLDEGIGITDEMLQQFQNHQPETRPTPGTAGELGAGLGLALCYEFLRYHGEELKIERPAERGTCVSFCLPLAL